LPRLFIAAEFRLICAVNRLLTASPAASSCGWTIRDPVESRDRDFVKFRWEVSSMRAPVMAARFVLIIISTNPFVFYSIGIRAADEPF
jgi:hypothetical protein